MKDKKIKKLNRKTPFEEIEEEEDDVEIEQDLEKIEGTNQEINDPK